MRSHDLVCNSKCTSFIKDCMRLEGSNTNMESSANVSSLERAHKHIQDVSFSRTAQVLPNKALLFEATTHLLSSLPDQALGIEETTTHLLNTIVPGLSRSSLSPNYYGFVTGGATPAARVADSIVTAYDRKQLLHTLPPSVMKHLDSHDISWE